MRNREQDLQSGGLQFESVWGNAPIPYVTVLYSICFYHKCKVPQMGTILYVTLFTELEGNFILKVDIG